MRRARRDPPLGGGVQAGAARTAAGGLLIADECHGLGGETLRRALLPQYEERLGLTATLERSDDAVTELLLPYFGGICYRYGFEQAIADGVCAPPARRVRRRRRCRSTNAPSTPRSSSGSSSARNHLRQVRDMPLEPFGDFLAAVAHLAERDAGADGRAARDYLDAFSKRRQIVAQSSGKYELLGSLAPAIKDADGALVFTETVRAANHAINRLDPLVSIDLITGSTARRQRREILDDLRVRQLDAVAAPRVLDEGIDVPDANLGIVMSASRTRRQMIQRMGRILRRKQPGVAARFVIMFAKDTLEDPAQPHRARRLPRRDRTHLRSDAACSTARSFEALDAFLAAPGPDGRARTRAPRALRRGAWRDATGRRVATSRSPTRCSRFARPSRSSTDPRLEPSSRGSTPRLPAADRRRARISSSRSSNLPQIAKPRVEAEAAVDRAGAARDRARRVGVADQLHRMRRSITARPVPLAGARPDRAPAAATDVSR